MGEMEVVLITEPNVPDWLNDAPKLEGTHCCTGQEGREQKMVPRTDDYDFIQVAQVFSLLEVPKDAVASPARTQDDKVPPV